MTDPSELATLFPQLSARDLHVLVAIADEHVLAAGDALFHEGEAADSFYVVRAGSLDVLVRDSAGAEQRLASVAAGEMVGEMGVLHGSPRAATVRAARDTRLLKFPLERLTELLQTAPAIHAAMAEAVARRLPSLYLASVPIFAGLDAETLREFDVAANWVQLAGGETLFREGDSADYLYVLVRGRLEVLVARAGGGHQVSGHLGRGGLVGEVAFLTRQPRTATVRAIRDSELVRLSQDALERLLARRPQSAIEMLRVLAARVRPLPPPPRQTLVATIAVVPVGSEPVPDDCSSRLVAALIAEGRSTLHVTPGRIDDALGAGTVASLHDESSRRRVAAWLHDRADHVRHVVFECDRAPSPWAELCLRQADLLLLVASAQGAPAPSPLHEAMFGSRASQRHVDAELVLVHPPATTSPSGTARWLDVYPVARHHHVRHDRHTDYARVARLITGTSVSVALSGGGARAFGHIGVLQALEECGVSIDALSGVSAGCFASGLYAMGHDPAAIVAIADEGVGKYNPLHEATLPIVSFLSGHKSVAMFRSFLNSEIEDLWIPFFCLSSNLTRAEVRVHDRGTLWRAVRASTAVPGVQPPVCADGDLLVDGGVLNNLPTDVMRARFGGTVIASDVSLAVDLTTDIQDLTVQSGWPLAWNRLRRSGGASTLPHIFEILLRTATLSSVRHGSTAAAEADLYIRLPVDGVATLDWKAGPGLVERCYRHALREIQAWKSAGTSRS